MCKTQEGIALLTPKTGVAPGLHNATNMFNHSYDQALQEYYKKTAQQTSLLNVTSPVNNALINVAHSSFVDDVCSTSATCDNSQMCSAAKTMSNALTQSFQPRGYKQNESKATMVAKAFGQGAHARMHELAKENPGLNTHCRYLGPQLHWAGGNMPEVRARRVQAWQAFKAFGKVWSTGVPRNFKVNLFISSVQSVLLSAATTFVLIDKEVGMLRTTHQQMLRVILLGKACTKTFVDGKKSINQCHTLKSAAH